MRRIIFAVALVTLVACSGEKKNNAALSRKPVSVRGWVLDVKDAKRAESPEMEIARRQQLFQATSLWVENNQYASGGIGENGAFIVLDVPPQNAVIGFNAPGAETARLVLQNVPPSADVLIPNVILENGGAKVLDPKNIQVRVAKKIPTRKASGETAFVAGYMVPVMDVPLAELTDRREYPQPPGFRPVATVR